MRLYRKKINGSMTIEAAVAIPFFLFFTVAMMYFLLIISLQSDIQLSMEETARSLGKKVYLAEKLESIPSSETTDADTAGILTAGINSLTIKTWMLKDGLAGRIDRSKIRGGVDGFYVYHSSFDRESGILDIIVNYTYELPFLPRDIGSIRFVQRCRSHVWTGKSLKESSRGSEGDEQGKKVYVTPYGTVYHTSKDCHYLDLSVRSVSYDEVDAVRNKDGGKYYMCSDCCKGKDAFHTVYITDYGTNWHSDINCTGLKRTVMTVDLSDVGDKHICPMCGGQGHE